MFVKNRKMLIGSNFNCISILSIEFAFTQKKTDKISGGVNPIKEILS